MKGRGEELEERKSEILHCCYYNREYYMYYVPCRGLSKWCTYTQSWVKLLWGGGRCELNWLELFYSEIWGGSSAHFAPP